MSTTPGSTLAAIADARDESSEPCGELPLPCGVRKEGASATRTGAPPRWARFPPIAAPARPAISAATPVRARTLRPGRRGDGVGAGPSATEEGAADGAAPHGLAGGSPGPP